jgi:hypothetical protein
MRLRGQDRVQTRGGAVRQERDCECESKLIKSRRILLFFESKIQ